jgi:serine/threonine protein phosphatase PrpC
VLYCANVGDSRIVLSRLGLAMPLTRVHNIKDDAEKDRVAQIAGGTDHQRAVFILPGKVLGYSMTRSLGDHEMIAGFNVKDFLDPTPSTTRTVLRPGDEFCILASDGVCLVLLRDLLLTTEQIWDAVTEQQAVTFVQSRLAVGGSLVQTSRDLVQFALEQRQLKSGTLSFDDVTVLILAFFWL